MTTSWPIQKASDESLNIHHTTSLFTVKNIYTQPNFSITTMNEISQAFKVIANVISISQSTS